MAWVVNNAQTYNIASVNISAGDGKNFGQSVTDPNVLDDYGISDELAALANLNVIVVAAAGNSFCEFNSVEGVAYPAADVNALAVSAVWDANNGGPWTWGTCAADFTTGPDRIMSISQRDRDVTDIFAPGGLITAAANGGGFTSFSGTSFAAPHITGVAALAQQLATEHLGHRLSMADFAAMMRQTGVLIFDGDDENDNVANTQAQYLRVDIPALANLIVPPEVAARTPASVYLTTASVNIDLTFSEVVNGVDISDLVLSGSATAGASQGAPTNVGGNMWRFPVSGLVAGVLNASLAPDAGDILDTAGNSLSNVQWSYTVDLTAPIITNRVPTPGASMNVTSVDVDVTFSEAVTGVDVTDLVLSGGASGSATKGSPINIGGNIWRFPINGLVTGPLNLSLSPDMGDITDAAGNNLSNVQWVYSIDITPPPAPSVPDLAESSDTGLGPGANTDNITNDFTPTFVGTAEPDALVQIFNVGTLIGSGIAVGGNYSITTNFLPTGTAIIRARARDAAGNFGVFSQPAVAVQIDAQLPSSPGSLDLTVESDSGPGPNGSTDNLTKDTTPTFTWSAATDFFSGISGYFWAVDDSTPETGGTFTAAASLTATPTVTANSSHNFYVKAVDVAGNFSFTPGSQPFTIDTQGPQVTSVTVWNTYSVHAPYPIPAVVDQWDQLMPVPVSGGINQIGGTMNGVWRTESTCLSTLAA